MGNNSYDITDIYLSSDLEGEEGFIKVLTAAGFVTEQYTEEEVFYYHPQHWEPVGEGGDIWYYEAEFKALTPQAVERANS